MKSSYFIQNQTLKVKNKGGTYFLMAMARADGTIMGKENNKKSNDDRIIAGPAIGIVL